MADTDEVSVEQAVAELQEASGTSAQAPAVEPRGSAPDDEIPLAQAAAELDAVRPASFAEGAQQMGSSFGRGLIDTGATALEGTMLGIGGLNKAVGLPGGDLMVDAARAYSGAVRDFAAKALPEVERLRDDFLLSSAPQALGSAVGFMLPGGWLKAAGVPAWASTMTLGAAVQSAAQFEDARLHGASEADQWKAYVLGGAIGTSEAIPISKILDRADKASGGSIRQALIHGLIEGGEEWLQESGSQIASNAIAAHILKYDKDRSVLEGALANGNAGFISGLILSALGTATAHALHKQETEGTDTLAGDGELTGGQHTIFAGTGGEEAPAVRRDVSPVRGAPEAESEAGVLPTVPTAVGTAVGGPAAGAEGEGQSPNAVPAGAAAGGESEDAVRGVREGEGASLPPGASGAPAAGPAGAGGEVGPVVGAQGPAAGNDVPVPGASPEAAPAAAGSGAEGAPAPLSGTYAHTDEPASFAMPARSKLGPVVELEHAVLRETQRERLGENGVDEENVLDLMEAMAAGTKIPPVVAIRTPKGELVVLDGHHRIEAARRLGFAKVPVRIVSAESAAAPAAGAKSEYKRTADVVATMRELVRQWTGKLTGDEEDLPAAIQAAEGVLDSRKAAGVKPTELDSVLEELVSMSRIGPDIQIGSGKEKAQTAYTQALVKKAEGMLAAFEAQRPDVERRATIAPSGSVAQTAERSIPNREAEGSTPSQPAKPTEADLPFAVNPDDIPLQLAIRAHAGTSHTPEERGPAHQRDYVRTMRAAHERLAPLAKTPEQKALLVAELEKFRDGYLKRAKAWLEAKARVISPLVTGPANFPVARNEKANRSADNRAQELVDYTERAQAAIRRALTKGERAAATAERYPGRVSREVEFEGGRVVLDMADDRLRLMFDDKPDAELLKELRGSGFKWAPSVKAWQRQWTENAERATERLLGISLASAAKPADQFDETRARIAVKTAESGKPFEAILLRGQGRKDSPYTGGMDEPVLGRGRYTTTERGYAEHFGPTITTHAVALKNPLVIDEDEQWRTLTRAAGWKFPNPFGTATDTTRANIAKLRALLEERGFDGVIVRLKLYDDTKLLRNVFGEDQVLEFHQRNPDAPIPGSKPLPVTPAPKNATPVEKKAALWGELPRPLMLDLGRATQIELANGKSIPANYGVMDANELIPSHDARRGFAPNLAGDLNERQYDDPVEGRPFRDNVERIAETLKASLLLTDSPTPTDGPPIVTSKGVVLGGNARAQAIQLAYQRDTEAADDYAVAVRRAVDRFAVAQESNYAGRPVLVRVIADGQEGAPGELSRILNESLTTAKGATTEAISRGSHVTPAAATEIVGVTEAEKAGMVEEDEDIDDEPSDDAVALDPGELPVEMQAAYPADPVQGGGANLGAPIGGRLRGALKPTKGVKGKVSQPDIIEALSKVVEASGGKTPIRWGRMGMMKNARGFFRVTPEVIRVRTANNVSTAAHEVGHAIEKHLLGWQKGSPWKKPFVDAGVQKELVKLGHALYGNTKPAAGYKREGFAEWIRLYTMEPASAPLAAPKLSAWFEREFLPARPEVRDALLEVRKLAETWRMQGSLARAEASIVEPTSAKEKLKRLRARVNTDAVIEAMVEVGRPVNELAREAERRMGRLLDPSEDPFYLFQALRSTHSARTKQMIESGMLDIAGNRVGPALAEIRPLVKGRYGDFMLYTWAKRSIALLTDPLGPREPGLSIEDARELERELTSPEFELAASKVYEWSEGLLNYAAQASPEFARIVEKIRKRDPGSYMPLQREFDELDNMWGAAKRERGLGTGGSVAKKLKGSGRRIKNPFPVLLANAERTVLAAHRRMVVDAIFKLSNVEGLAHMIEEVPVDQVPVASATIKALLERIASKAGIPKNEGELELKGTGFHEDTDFSDLLGETLTFFAPAAYPKGQDPVIPRWVDGQVKWYRMDHRVARMLAGMDVYRLPWVLDITLGATARAFRLGTTGIRASFGLITNPARDFQTLYQNTRSSAWAPRLFVEYVKQMAVAGLSHASGGHYSSPYLDAFLDLGAEMAQPLGQDMNHTARAARQLFQGKVVRVIDPRNALDFVRQVLQFPETGARVTELRLLAEEVGWKPGTPMTLDQSLQLLLAAKQATVDFSAAGWLARVANQTIPFFNAPIQGERASVRAARRSPGRWLFRGLQMTAATLALWWINKDKEWYRELGARTRALYWAFEFQWNGRSELALIPRAQEGPLLFGSLPEALADAWYRQDPKGAREFFGAALDTLTPGLLPVPAREVLEQASNRDFYWDRPIVPQGELRRAPEEQAGEYTSAVAKFLGDMFHVSPRRVDHAIRGTFGGVGSDVIDVVGLGGSAQEAGGELADAPVLGRLFQRGGPLGVRPQSIDRLYDAIEQADQIAASMKIEEGPGQKEHRLMLEDAGQAISALSYVRSQTKDIDQRRELTRKMVEIAATALKDASVAGRIARGPMQQERRQAQRLEEEHKR